MSEYGTFLGMLRTQRPGCPRPVARHSNHPITQTLYIGVLFRHFRQRLRVRGASVRRLWEKVVSLRWLELLYSGAFPRDSFLLAGNYLLYPECDASIAFIIGNVPWGI